MRIAELDRAFLQSEYKGSRAAMLAAGDYLTFDDDRIRRAFNFGAGTAKDMRRHIENNRKYCIYYDLDAGCYI